MGFIRKPILCICVAVLFFAYSGVNNKSLAKEKKDCYETALGQMPMNLCAHEHAQKENAALDKVYKKLMGKISPAGQAKLKLARDAWTVFRAEECEFETLGTMSGSIHPMVISECYAYLTNEYTKLLEAQLNCVEGDLSCGGQ
jgi:uncharacterized protein YecT (DUF1311 family)